MNLIQWKGNKIEIAPEAYGIKAYRTIWNMDKTSGKEKAILALTTLYFMYDPRSDYMFLSSDEERLAKIIEHEGLNKDFKLDAQMLIAAQVYKELIHTPSSLLLEQAADAMEKVRIFFASIDLTKTDNNGKLLYPINQITSALKDIPRLAREYQEAHRIVTQELQEKDKARGNKTMSMFEDGFGE